MRKIILCLLSISSGSVFALNNSLFQEFDNQINIGFGINQDTSGYGTTTTIMPHSWVYSTTNEVGFEVERLLNNGLWVDVNTNMAFGTGQINLNPIVGSNGGTYQSSDYGLNAKIGYAIPMLSQQIQVTPYASLGINSLASSIQYVPSSLIEANNFAYLAGVGARVEYRVNRVMELYADQLVGYYWDQSGPQNGIQPQNSLQFTSTLGAKFNLGQDFQLGVKGMYSNYQPMSDNYTSNGFMLEPQWSVGGMITLGLTY